MDDFGHIPPISRSDEGGNECTYLSPTLTRDNRDSSSQAAGQSSKLRLGETRMSRSNDSSEI